MKTTPPPLGHRAACLPPATPFSQPSGPPGSYNGLGRPRSSVLALGDVAQTTAKKIEIPSEVIAETTKCQKGFTCLSQPVEAVCKVESCVNGKFHFVRCATIQYCAYQRGFGYGYYCACPTRKAIYNRYKV